MKIVVDAMGSDDNPGPDVAGAVLAAREFGDTMILVGDQAQIEAELAKQDTAALSIEVKHASQKITMTDKPSDIVKGKPESSMHVGMALVKNGQADAFVTAGNTGGALAVVLALRPFVETGELPPEVLARQIAAISVGLVDGAPLLDLAYEEDVRAEMDFNVVMAGANQLVKVQGTAEKAPFARAQPDKLVNLATMGIAQLQALQNAVISSR
jgi:hypothetical protein